MQVHLAAFDCLKKEEINLIKLRQCMHTKYEPFLLCGILSLVFFSTEETLFFLPKLIPLLEIKRGKGMHKTLKGLLTGRLRSKQDRV